MICDNITTNNSSLDIQELGKKVWVRIVNQNSQYLEWEINKFYNWGGINGGEPYDEKSWIFLTDKSKFIKSISLILENRYRKKHCFEFSENQKDFKHFHKFLIDKSWRIYHNIQKKTL